MVSNKKTTANINPLSTLIVKTVQKKAAGLTAANMSAALRDTTATFNSSLYINSISNLITPVAKKMSQR
jgi:hypothetical protein